MVAGDLINSFLGRGSPFTGTMKDGKPVSTPSKTVSDAPAAPAPIYTPTQTKFKINPIYNNVQYNQNEDNLWSENYTCNFAGIEKMIVDFANQVYLGLQDKQSIIKSTQGFNAVSDIIAFNNKRNMGHDIIFIPRMYKSKKQIVDSFIDEVAKLS